MKQKKHSHTLMSDQQCSTDDCLTMIKQNVVDRKQGDSPLVCYAHYLSAKIGGRRNVRS